MFPLGPWYLWSLRNIKGWEMFWFYCPKWKADKIKSFHLLLVFLTKTWMIHGWWTKTNNTTIIYNLQYVMKALTQVGYYQWCYTNFKLFLDYICNPKKWCTLLCWWNKTLEEAFQFYTDFIIRNLISTQCLEIISMYKEDIKLDLKYLFYSEIHSFPLNYLDVSYK